MLERNFKKKQQDDLREQGWLFIQLIADASIPMGFPDTLCLSPTGYSCFVEWKKSEFAERQPLQQYWNKKLNSMGHDAFFVYPENKEEWCGRIVSESRKLPH